MPQPAFTVTAINLQRDEDQTFGPFPGYPHITYDFVRCQGDRGDHIFKWTTDDGPEAPDGSDEGWTNDDGMHVRDGWRRCVELGNQFGFAVGPFWSDLSFHVGTVPDEYVWPRDWNTIEHVDPVTNYAGNPITKSDHEALNT